MSSAIVLASSANTDASPPLSTIDANLDDFVVRVPSGKNFKYVRIVTVDEQVPNMPSKCLELEPEQLYELKCTQSHCMGGTTTKALASGFTWLIDRPDIIDCLGVAKVDGVSELFLRACTRPPVDMEKKTEVKGYEYDQTIMWRLNYETLKLLKVEVLSKDACPYPEIKGDKRFVYEYFKRTKEVAVDSSAGGPNRTYLENDFPRLLDFTGAKAKSITASMASSKKAMDTKLDKAYEKKQLPTDKLLRGHFHLLNDVVGGKRKADSVLCFEVMNAEQVETTRLGSRTIVMITPTRSVVADEAADGGDDE